MNPKYAVDSVKYAQSVDQQSNIFLHDNSRDLQYQDTSRDRQLEDSLIQESMEIDVPTE